MLLTLVLELANALLPQYAPLTSNLVQLFKVLKVQVPSQPLVELELINNEFDKKVFKTDTHIVLN